MLISDTMFAWQSQLDGHQGCPGDSKYSACLGFNASSGSKQAQYLQEFGSCFLFCKMCISML